MQRLQYAHISYMHAKCTIQILVPYLSSHPSCCSSAAQMVRTYVELFLLYARYCTYACLYQWLRFYRLSNIHSHLVCGAVTIYAMYSTCVCMYRWLHFYNLSNWGEPEQAPHRRVCCGISLYIYMYIYLVRRAVSHIRLLFCAFCVIR